MIVWTTEWPTSPGIYWFYGDLFGRKNRRDDLRIQMHLVRCHQGANGLVFVSDINSFVFKSEAVGVWTTAVLPDVPLVNFLKLDEVENQDQVRLCYSCGNILHRQVVTEKTQVDTVRFYVGFHCDDCGPFERTSGYFTNYDGAAQYLEYLEADPGVSYVVWAADQLEVGPDVNGD